MFRYAIHNKRYPVSQPKCIISPYKQKFKKKKNIQRTSLVLKISRKILVKYLRKKQTKIQFSKNVKVVLNLTINTAVKFHVYSKPNIRKPTLSKHNLLHCLFVHVYMYNFKKNIKFKKKVRARKKLVKQFTNLVSRRN